MTVRQHLDLVIERRVTHGNTDRETVHLRVRKERRTGSAGRVLCRDDDERLRQRICLIVYRDLAFFHGFEESGLRTGRRTVELIREEKVVENGTLLILHGACFRV